MIEHPYDRRPAMQHDHYKSKEDQLLREVRELRRIMEALAAHLGVTGQTGGTHPPYR